MVAIGVALRWTLFRPAAVPVTVFRVARGRVEDTVTNSRAGTVKSRRRASLSPDLGGRVHELPAREGDAVREGQVLMRLFDGDVRAEVDMRARAVDAAAAGHREACLRAAQAGRDLDRAGRLSQDAIVSVESLDQAQSRRAMADAACDAARAAEAQAIAALAFARVNLSKTVLRAPFGGIVSEVSAEVGEWITPSPPGVPIPPVMVLFDPAAIYVSAPMDEVDVAKVATGLPVRVTFDAYPGRAETGRVTRVAPYVLDVEEQNRTFEIEVSLDDAAFAGKLLPGTSADVEVILDRREDVPRIPAYALMEGNRVLVVREGRLEGIQVEPGLKNWEFVEIVRGLSPGHAVVVSLDRAEVKEGAEARVVAETLR